MRLKKNRLECRERKIFMDMRPLTNITDYIYYFIRWMQVNKELKFIKLFWALSHRHVVITHNCTLRKGFHVSGLRNWGRVHELILSMTQLMSHLTPKSEYAYLFLAFNEYLELLRQHLKYFCHPHSITFCHYHVPLIVIFFPLNWL